MSDQSPSEEREPTLVKVQLPSWRWIFMLLGSIAAVGLASLVFLAFFRQVKDLLIWVVVALFASFALEPAVDWLAKRGWRRGVATGVILFGLAVFAVVMVALMIPLVVTQLRELIDAAPDILRTISGYTTRWFNVDVSPEALQQQLSSADSELGQFATNVAGNLFGFATSILGTVFKLGRPVGGRIPVRVARGHWSRLARRRHELVFSFLQPRNQTVLPLRVGICEPILYWRCTLSARYTLFRQHYGAAARPTRTRLDPGFGSFARQDAVVAPAVHMPQTGLLSTAGNLVFGGTEEGQFFALDDRTGKEFWHANTGGMIAAAPDQLFEQREDSSYRSPPAARFSRLPWSENPLPAVGPRPLGAVRTASRTRHVRTRLRSRA